VEEGVNGCMPNGVIGKRKSEGFDRSVIVSGRFTNYNECLREDLEDSGVECL
jgi:hypothetical protein